MANKRIAVGVVMISLLLTAACGSDDDTTEQAAVTTTAAPTTSTTAPTSTEASAPESSDADEPVDEAPDPVVVDEAFLMEQASKSLGPDQPGAVMVAVFDAAGSSVHAALGTDPAGAPPQLDDAFRVGSITKAFTAITVMTLVDDGAVDLDGPVSDYVTRVAIDGDVTVRDVLRHSGGIDDPTGFLTAIADDRSRVWTPEDVLAITRLDDLEPGTAHEYANVNYNVLGVLIEDVTGQPYHEVVRERILEPIGMNGTYLAYYETGAEVFAGYYDVFGESGFGGTPEPIDFDLTSTETYAWASGAMVSTPGDLHLLMSALFGGELLPASLVDEMTPETGYGLGLEAPDFESASPLFGHSGRIAGSGTWLIHAPDTGATVFTVSNGDHLLVSPATRAVAEAIGSPEFTLGN